MERQTSVIENTDGSTRLTWNQLTSKGSPLVITLRRVSWDDPSEARCQLLVSLGNTLPVVSQHILTFSMSPTVLDQMANEFGELLLDAILTQANGKITLDQLTNYGGEA